MSQEKNASKGESGLLEVRKVNCVDQFHTNPRSIINLMSLVLKNDLSLSIGATHRRILKIWKEVFDLPICWSFLYDFVACCFLTVVGTAPADLRPQTRWDL